MSIRSISYDTHQIARGAVLAKYNTEPEVGRPGSFDPVLSRFANGFRIPYIC